MHHRPSGLLFRRTVRCVLALVVLGVVAVLAVPGRAAADTDIGSLVRQEDGTTGPLDPADRDVLHKVKQAGLWEMPVGSSMSERAEDPRVREVGRLIAAEHAELDALVETAAAEVGVALPVEPTAQQQDWIAEIAAQPRTTFDQRAVFLVRQAHGAVLPVLAQVRAATENAVVREFTAAAMTFVQRHIEYLESTGLVDYAALPDPAALGSDDWRSHTMTFVVQAALAALLTALFLVAGRAVADRARRRAPIPRAPARGHHARS
jgi:predicted outer membrane protein